MIEIGNGDGPESEGLGEAKPMSGCSLEEEWREFWRRMSTRVCVMSCFVSQRRWLGGTHRRVD